MCKVKWQPAQPISGWPTDYQTEMPDTEPETTTTDSSEELSVTTKQDDAASDRTQRVEYNLVPVGRIDTDLYRVLNEMAEAGWQLVDTTVVDGSTDQAIFERPVDAGGEDDE